MIVFIHRITASIRMLINILESNKILSKFQLYQINIILIYMKCLETILYDSYFPPWRLNLTMIFDFFTIICYFDFFLSLFIDNIFQ